MYAVLTVTSTRGVQKKTWSVNKETNAGDRERVAAHHRSSLTSCGARNQYADLEAVRAGRRRRSHFSSVSPPCSLAHDLPLLHPPSSLLRTRGTVSVYFFFFS